MSFNALLENVLASGTKESSDAVERFFGTDSFLIFRNAVQNVVIEDVQEPLVEIPKEEFFRFEPHAYVSAGAPYGNASPFSLRSGVLSRLREAQAFLRSEAPGYSFKIFDGYRPAEVQQYMVDYHIRLLAEDDGRKTTELSESERNFYRDKVLQIFAAPSKDSKRPTPHSTGAAVDLTIVDDSGIPIPMGSEIDAMPPEGLPNYFKNKNLEHSGEFQRNRELLWRSMSHTGFQRLPQEWWHFSFGDQCWAVLEAMSEAMKGRSVQPKALYGRIDG